MVLCDGQMVVFTWECGKMVFKAASVL
jgi:hypothetical protein